MKYTRLLLIFCLVAALAETLVGKAQPLPANLSPKPDITLSTDSVTLEWRLPVAKVSTNNEGEVEVRMSGFESENQPGAAILPYTSVLVALPPQAVPVLQIGQTLSVPFSLPGALARVPAGNGTPRSATPALQVSASALVMEEIGVLRGVRLARITLHPAHIAGDHLEMVSQIQATVHFNAPVSISPQGLNDPLVRMVQEQVVNPSQVQPNFPAEPVGVLAPDLPSATPATAIIDVNQAGIVQVTYSMLLDAGFPVNQVDPRNLKLTHGGVEVAYEWAAPQDSSFTTGEALRFYATPRFSRWSVNDTYLLYEGSAPGKSITSRSATITGGMTPGNAWVEKAVEQNLLYTPDCLCDLPVGRDGDRWVWDYLLRIDSSGTNPSSQYTFSLEGVDPAGTNQLTLWLIGGTDITNITPDHKARLSLNGTSLGDVTWEGKTAVERVVNIPTGVLTGTNTLTLELPGLPGVSIDGVWMDAFKVSYQLSSNQPVTNAVFFTGEGPADHSYSATLNSTTNLLAYDITDALSPVRLNGYFQSGISGTTITIGDPGLSAAPAYFLVNSEGILTPKVVRLQKALSTTALSAVDYLIIQPDGYESALSSLVTLRSHQGLKVAAENLQAIYDQFSEGRLDPEAIRSFLASAYTKWHPQYVVLVGDGSVDPKHYLSNSKNMILPPYLINSDPYNTDSASDNRFVSVHGGDNLPEMMVGRLPANSLAEAAAMVNKIVQFETAPVPGLWRSTTSFISGNKDAGGNFPAIAQQVSSLIPSSSVSRRLFYGSTITDPDQMHSEVINAWNSGSALMVYFGHSSVHQWASIDPLPIKNFFHLNELAGLTNAMKLPVVLEMTCLTGSFNMKDLSSLDEELIRKPAGGAIAVWGSTSEGISTGHKYLAEGFIRSFTGRPNFGQVGKAAYAGQINLATFDTSNLFGYLIDSFILFGDPATQVAMQLYRVDLPLITK